MQECMNAMHAECKRRLRNDFFQKTGDLHAILKRWESECNFTKCRVQNANFQDSHASGQVLKSNGKSTCNFEINRV